MAKRATAAARTAATEIGRGTPLGTLWVGRHSGDRDILVLDPDVASSNPQNVSLYSLTQHRLRTFPRSVMAEKIHALEEAELEKAIEEYSSRTSRREVYEDGLRAAEAQRRTRQRNEFVRSHERYLERIGVRDAGVTDTLPGHKNGRRSKCHACGIDLDDFVGLVCGGCSSVLCSCGACACGTAGRKRAGTPADQTA
jgi:hypothetical protein